jgi:hypothetical protein
LEVLNDFCLRKSGQQGQNTIVVFIRPFYDSRDSVLQFWIQRAKTHPKDIPKCFLPFFLPTFLTTFLEAFFFNSSSLYKPTAMAATVF